MSKKILSLALVVIMLFSVCSVTANAEIADGATIALRVTSDAKVGDPAGTIVTISVFYDLPNDSDEYQMQNGNLSIAWNSARFALDTKETKSAWDARDWGEAYADYFKPKAAVTISGNTPKNIVAKFSDADKAHGWDSACQVQQAYNTDNTSAEEGYPCHSGEVLFTLRFKARDTITADDVIGIPEGPLKAEGFTACRVCYFDGSNAPAELETSKIDMTQLVGAPSQETVKYDVYNLKGLDKTSPADKHSEGNGKNTVAVYFGLGMDPVVNKDTGKTTFITAITATVTVKSNGETITVNTAELDKNGEIKYVYKVGEGYGFRVILQNVPDDADVTVTPSLVYEGDAAYNIETVSFNVADAYARS